jgi:hypothetical protein
LRQVEETQVGLRKQTSVLDFADCHTLFLCEISVRFGREYLLENIVVKIEKGSFCCKQAYSAKLGKHIYLSKENRL